MGYEYADAQNYAIRCFLNQFSKQFNYFDEFYKEKTIEFFDNKCPYTGIELTSKNSVRDHVMPMNRECCGLHIYGNILIVSKEANSAKSSDSLENFLYNEPEKLAKIKQFIKETGYGDIHNKYNNELKVICSELYQEVGNLVKNTYENFTINVSHQNKEYKNLIKPYRTPVANKLTNLTNIQKNEKEIQKLTKSEIKYICNKNQFYISSNNNFTKASKNLTQNTYWANPTITCLNKEWKLVLDDYYNKNLYCFCIPANTIFKNSIVVRADKPELIDLQIYYNDKTFSDSRSGISFAKWLVKTINY